MSYENLRRAWKRVKRNGGAAGVDGLSLAQTARHLTSHWPAILEQIFAGKYRPSPVRQTMIEKDGGRGERRLGIPTITDRFLQQALLQVLQPIIDPTFSEHSYGFRPGRSAHQAVKAAQGFVQAGYRIVVDVDLAEFFDSVNHNVLISRLRRRGADTGVIRLIRAYLNSGMMVHGVVVATTEGTPQGGPLSPLLANVLLDEVDRELERRGHRFVRYADDCNVYVGSRRAGEKVMGLLRRLYARLHLRVNETKSAVGSVFGRKFLGYSFWVAKGRVVKPRVAKKALRLYCEKIKHLTRRSAGRSIGTVVADLQQLIPGWKSYFNLAETPHIWLRLDEWTRHRLRAYLLKQWKCGTTVFKRMRALGASKDLAAMIAANSRRWWHDSDRLLKTVLTVAYFDKLGVPRLIS